MHPFSFEPSYHALTKDDMALLEQDPNFIEVEYDFEQE